MSDRDGEWWCSRCELSPSGAVRVEAECIECAARNLAADAQLPAPAEPYAEARAGD